MDPHRGAGPYVNEKFVSLLGIGATLANLRCLAVTITQVVQLGAPHPTAGDHFDGFDGGGMHRELTFHTHTEGNLADIEGGTQAITLAGDNNTLERLGTGAVTFHHAYIYPHGVTGAEIRDIVAQTRSINYIKSLHYSFTFRLCTQARGAVIG